MDRVEEIEAAIERLTAPEFRRIAQWFWEREHKLCEAQLDQDSASGKLDFLFEEADQESCQERLRDWPASE